MYDSPTEYLAGLASADGRCIGQIIMPVADGFHGHCSCGRWDVDVSTQEEGLRLARLHTDETAA
jgi:hypothetical protein